MTGYNPIYKGVTPKMVDAIYDNLEAERVADRMNVTDEVACVYLDESGVDRLHDFIVCAEANDAPHDLCRANMDADPQRLDDEAAMREEAALDNYADGRRLAKAGPL